MTETPIRAGQGAFSTARAERCKIGEGCRWLFIVPRRNYRVSFDTVASFR